MKNTRSLRVAFATCLSLTQLITSCPVEAVLPMPDDLSGHAAAFNQTTPMTPPRAIKRLAAPTTPESPQLRAAPKGSKQPTKRVCFGLNMGTVSISPSLAGDSAVDASSSGSNSPEPTESVDSIPSSDSGNISPINTENSNPSSPTNEENSSVEQEYTWYTPVTPGVPEEDAMSFAAQADAMLLSAQEAAMSFIAQEEAMLLAAHEKALVDAYEEAMLLAAYENALVDAELADLIQSMHILQDSMGTTDVDSQGSMSTEADMPHVSSMNVVGPETPEKQIDRRTVTPQRRPTLVRRDLLDALNRAPTFTVPSLPRRSASVPNSPTVITSDSERLPGITPFSPIPAATTQQPLQAPDLSAPSAGRSIFASALTLGSQAPSAFAIPVALAGQRVLGFARNLFSAPETPQEEPAAPAESLMDVTPNADSAPDLQGVRKAPDAPKKPRNKPDNA